MPPFDSRKTAKTANARQLLAVSNWLLAPIPVKGFMVALVMTISTYDYYSKTAETALKDLLRSQILQMQKGAWTADLSEKSAENSQSSSNSAISQCILCRRCRRRHKPFIWR